jgi:hypothetical protein
MQYINNVELLEEYQLSLSKNVCSKKLLSYFTTIANRSSKIFVYRSDYDRDACVNYAIAEAWRKWKTFNNKFSDNPFSFYTTMILNDMKNEYRKMYKNSHQHISLSLFNDL